MTKNHFPHAATLSAIALLFASMPSLCAQSFDRKVVEEMGLWDSHATLSSKRINLMLGAEITVSSHGDTNTPDMACDGVTEVENYWLSDELPAWHQADLGELKSISGINILLSWEDGRVYQYVVEGSEDGETWFPLVDERANSIACTAEGNSYSFSPRQARYLRTTITNCSGDSPDARLIEIEAIEEEAKQSMSLSAHDDLHRINWTGDIEAPAPSDKTVRLKGWRGERVNAQIAISSNQELKQLRLATTHLCGVDHQIPFKASFVKFTKAKGTPTADIISDDEDERITNPAGVNRSVWISLDIPSNLPAGSYTGRVNVQAEGQEEQNIPVVLTVQDQTLPAPKDWGIHLDIWQHAEAVARWHGVKAWSDEHLMLMKPLMKRLADAGQKVITCTLIDEAWRGQTYDHYGSMVEWVKEKDGTMSWDYSKFDKYVTFMMEEVGIKEQISCYTMVPWSQQVRILNKATDEYELIDCKPGQESFKLLWTDFIIAFAKHLEEKGWLNITGIALDERPDYMIQAAKEVLDKHAPALKIISAVDKPSTASDMVYDMSPALLHTDTITDELLAERKAAGKKTTFYVCCWPERPNNFTHSPIAESEWMGMYAALNNLDGFLRWAYNSWNRNPFENTDFGTWMSGDCFLVYPGNLSSVRFEKMRDGFEEFEKLNLLRQQAQSDPKLKAKLDAFEASVKPYFDKTKITELDYMEGVKAFRAGLRALCE
ncbi:MAG: DUF6067 family protein [Akkermansia sp.]